MKVLRQGTKPLAVEQRIYQTTCPTCRSELEFTGAEATLNTWRNETVVSVTCPVCNHDLTVDEDDYLEARKAWTRNAEAYYKR